MDERTAKLYEEIAQYRAMLSVDERMAVLSEKTRLLIYGMGTRIVAFAYMKNWHTGADLDDVVNAHFALVPANDQWMLRDLREWVMPALMLLRRDWTSSKPTEGKVLAEIERRGGLEAMHRDWHQSNPT